MAFFHSIRADTVRQYGTFSWGRLAFGVLLRRTFRVVITARLCQAACARAPVLLPVLKVFHRLSCQLAGVDFPWDAQIGAGLALTHGWGLVISRGTRIGKNVTLFHGVTLGRRERIGREGDRTTQYPVLEDEVWVGPHAIIVGGVTIGRGSRIAGGAFVSESIPPYSVVQGNPARIVKRDCVPDVTWPAAVA